MSRIFTVSEVNRYLRSLFVKDLLLNSISVSGEISNKKTDYNGNLYFTLKDKDAALPCVMFRSSIPAPGKGYIPDNGDRTVVSGRIDIYEKTGRVQLYVNSIKKEGLGDLYEKYLKLKKELEETGMFDSSYKMPVKKYNMKIGVVTAPTGAVIQDIRNVAERRNPFVQLYLYPAVVQGAKAADTIVKGIEFFNRFGADVIIIGRGGGSIEDLWAFNEEKVARAVFASAIPVISAVGHDTDFTISDFVADLRAPTPSAAAEIAVFDINEYYGLLEAYKNTLKRNVLHKLDIANEKLIRSEHDLKMRHPGRQLADRKIFLSDLKEKLTENMYMQLNTVRDIINTKDKTLRDGLSAKMTDTEHRISILAEKFKGLSPFERLKQGFSFIQDEAHKKVSSISQVDKGDRLDLRVSDGTIVSVVEGVIKADG